MLAPTLGTSAWSHLQNAMLIRYLAVLMLFVIGGFLTACGSDDDEVAEAVEASQTDGSTESVSSDVESESTALPTLEEQRSQIVRELRTMMEIETASHSAETLVERESEGGLFSGDKLLLVAHGSVAAGVDLIDVSEADVDIVDETTVRVTLSASMILSAELDQSRTQVISRETGFLSDEDEGLEAEALEEAETKILQSACEHDILVRAAEQAELRVSAILSGLGFEEPKVISEAGDCSDDGHP